MATAIKKASGLKPKVVAKLTAIGPMTSTVAALLRNGVTAMAVIMMRAMARQAVRHLS